MKTLHILTCLALGATILTGCRIGGASDSTVRYLDEFDLTTMSCGLKMRPQARKSVRGHALRLGDKTYARGVGTHVESVYLLRANGKVASFDAVVGIDRETQELPASWCTRKNWGCASFRVYADGRLVVDSGVLKEQDAPKAIHADLTGAEAIVLECSDGGHWAGYEASDGDWGDARFTLLPGATLTAAPASDPLMRQLGVLTPPEKPEPSVNGASDWGVRPGHPVVYRLPISGVRPIEVSVAGLPEGVRLNPANNTLEGLAPKTAGDWPLVVRVRNAHGSCERTITLRVGERISLTPPMGWNSWNIWGGGVTDAKVRAAARAMDASGLAEHGWAYVNIDDWWMKNASAGKTRKNHAGPLRDEKGRILPQGDFPDMKALGDYIHALGLKYGIYSSPGETTCGGCAGSLGHEMTDAATWADWGVDYVKYDWCSYGNVFGREIKGRQPTTDDFAKPYRLMSKCLRAQSRDILHAFCQYGMGNVQAWGEDAGAQVWRSWGDLKDSWTCLLNATESYAEAYRYTRPGFWCDPDMMVLGVLSTAGGRHPTYLTPNEQYTHMSLWCLLNAPLLLGCDLEALDEFTRSLLVNDEVIAISQDSLGRQAGRVSHDDDTDVWMRPLANGDTALGVVNRRPFARTVTVSLTDAGLWNAYAMRDLWRQADLGTVRGTITLEIPAHATALIRLKPTCLSCESRKAESKRRRK